MFRIRVPRRALAALAATSLSMGVHESSPRERLPIYPPPPIPILLVDTPSRLEQHIGTARRTATQAWQEAHGRVQGIVGRWIKAEEAVEYRIKSILSPSEQLTPGLLYVGVATLTGSIISRTRTLPIRLLLPPSLLILSLHHFLPSTTQNLTKYLTSLEEKYLPGVAEKHAVARAHTRMAWETTKERVEEGRVRFRGTAVGIVGQVQEATGLKLREAFGWGTRSDGRAGKENARGS